MTIIFKTELLERKDIVTGTIKALKLKLKSFPEGKITIRHHNTASYYYLQSKDGQKYLNKSYSKLIGELIQKEYLQNVLETLEQASRSGVHREHEQFTEPTTMDFTATTLQDSLKMDGGQ